MTARIILALVMLVIGGTYLSWRLIGTGKGQHAAPRGFTEADERLADTSERVIPRAITEHAPPWDPAPAFEAAPVIEPAAVTPGPPQPASVWDDPPEAIIIGVGTMSGGRVTSAHVTIVPPVQCPALPQWVTDILGADSVDGAMTEISRVVHSWESNYTKGDARYLRALTDGAS